MWSRWAALAVAARPAARPRRAGRRCGRRRAGRLLLDAGHRGVRPSVVAVVAAAGPAVGADRLAVAGCASSRCGPGRHGAAHPRRRPAGPGPGRAAAQAGQRARHRPVRPRSLAEHPARTSATNPAPAARWTAGPSASAASSTTPSSSAAPGHSRDRAGLIVFGRQPRLELPPSDAPRFNLTELPPARDGNYTDIAAAIKLALASFPEGTGKRIVLISDGNENLGNAEEQARLAKSIGVQIDVVPLAAGQRNEDEVLVERVEAPPLTEQGPKVPIRVLVRSFNPITSSASSTLKQITEGEVARRSASRARSVLRIRPELVLVRPAADRRAAVVHLRGGVPAANGTRTTDGVLPRGQPPGDRLQNNQASAHVVARGQRRILILEGKAGRASSTSSTSCWRPASRSSRSWPSRSRRARQLQGPRQAGRVPEQLRLRHPGQRAGRAGQRGAAGNAPQQHARPGLRPDHDRRPGQLRRRRLAEHAGREGAAGRFATSSRSRCRARAAWC